MIERMQLLMKINQLSAADLADKLGTERSGISHFLSGRNKPSLAFVIKLLEKFPEINPDWLIMGSGPMLRSEQKPTVTVNETNTSSITAKEQSAQLSIEPAQEKVPMVKDEDPVEYSASTKTNRPEKPEVKQIPVPLINSGSSEIERIVIFYNDHSFSEYKMR